MLSLNVFNFSKVTSIVESVNMTLTTFSLCVCFKSGSTCNSHVVSENS